MNFVKSASLSLTLLVATSASLFAGDSRATVSMAARTTSVRTRSDERRGAWRAVAAPFIFVGRALDTFLHAPRIFAEGIEGERVLVGRHGVLASREVPPEDRIISPED